MIYKIYQHNDQELWRHIGRFGFDANVRRELGIPLTSDGSTWWIVAFDGETVTGFGALKVKRRLMGHVYVLPEYRRRGICKELVNKRLDLARELGMSHLQIVILPERFRHYKPLGFVKKFERGKYWVCELEL